MGTYFVNRTIKANGRIARIGFNIFRQPRRNISPTRHFSTALETNPLPTGGHVAHLSFQGEKKLPILNPAALVILTDTIHTLASDGDLRGLFMRSTIAGADLNFMRAIGGRADAEAFIRLIDGLCSAIQAFPGPVVAVCDGPCLGAGLEVAVAADFRVAVDSPSTIFAMPETKVGIPSVVQACLIPGLIGWGNARRMLYFGESIDCATALSWGLVNDVVAPEKLEELIRQWEERIALTGMKALRSQKALMTEWEELGCGREGVEAGVRAFGKAFEGDEPRRMMNDFFVQKQRRKESTRG